MTGPGTPSGDSDSAARASGAAVFMSTFRWFTRIGPGARRLPVVAVAARPGHFGEQQRTADSRPGSRPRFGPAAVAITGSRTPARPPAALPSGSPLPGLQDRGSRSGPPPHSGRPRPPPAGSRNARYRRRASASRHGADPPDRIPPLGRASRSLRVRRFRGRPIEARGPAGRRSPAGAARRIENPGSAARRPRFRLHRRPDPDRELSAPSGSRPRSGPLWPRHRIEHPRPPDPSLSIRPRFGAAGEPHAVETHDLSIFRASFLRMSSQICYDPHQKT